MLSATKPMSLHRLSDLRRWGLAELHFDIKRCVGVDHLLVFDTSRTQMDVSTSDRRQARHKLPTWPGQSYYRIGSSSDWHKVQGVKPQEVRFNRGKLAQRYIIT